MATVEVFDALRGGADMSGLGRDAGLFFEDAGGVPELLDVFQPTPDVFVESYGVRGADYDEFDVTLREEFGGFGDFDDLVVERVSYFDGFEQLLIWDDVDLVIPFDGVFRPADLSPGLAFGGDDTLFGARFGDDLRGFGGDDLIDGGGGDDDLFGGSGDDDLFGGDGDDALSGGSGADLLVGDDDRDLLFGGSGDDLLLGGDDEDRLIGGRGWDEIEGGRDDDLLVGRAGRDLLKGEGGDDILRGGRLRDILDGGDGDDVLRGQAQGDRLFGGEDDDDLHGQRGRDVLRGEDGRDYLDGGKGDDRLVGGDDPDIFRFRPGFGDDVIADFDPRQAGERIDLLDIRAIRSFDDLVEDHLFSSGRGAVIAVDRDSILLRGVDADELSQNDFLL